MNHVMRKTIIGLLFILALIFCVVCSYADEEYTVTLEYEDGISRAHHVYAAQGSSIDEPAMPVRQGYDFVGWSTSPDGSEQAAFPYTLSENITLYAIWEAHRCRITFDTGIEGAEPIVYKAEYNSEVNAPEAPEREGWSFTGWTTEDGNIVTFPVTAAADTCYRASWAEGDLNIVTLDLNYDEGGVWATFMLADGESVTKKMVTEPERENYKFSGWSETPDGKTVKLPYKAKASKTLYAIWKRNEYKVAFRNEYVDNQNVVFFSTTIDGGESVNAPDTVPVRESYTFAGWYTASSGGEEISFPFTPTGNCAIYAQWKHEPVVTDVFQAEYTFIDPNETFPGYSGSARGTGIIATVTTETGVVVDEDAPLNSKYIQPAGKYITYLYKDGAALEFVINASEAGTATLKANLAIEMQPNWVFAPTGENGYSVYVNGEELDYGTISFVSSEAGGAGYKSPFQTFRLGTIRLQEGENVIRLVTSNSNVAFGGTMKAVAPMVDCIMIEGYTGQLSWSPVYDNLY